MAAAASTNSNDQPIYNTSRRKGIGKRIRCGPTPIEDSKERKNERPGQLSLSKQSSDETQGLAGSIELLEYFLRLSQDDSKEEYIDTIYILALIRSGADINSVDDYGQTVLHAAARDWSPDAARFLIDNGADVNKADLYGRTPIFTAILFDYPEMIEFLASRGANIHQRTIGERQTTVHYAIRGNAVNSLRTLLKLGVSVMDEDYKGRNPLFIAAEQGNSDVMQYLLDIGCPAASYDKYGYSAMAHMVEKMPNIALEALSQFADVDQKCDMKSYFLAPLEFDTNNSMETWDQKNALQMIVKYKETDLLLHPVMQRLVKIKWETFGRFHILNYFFLNLIYVLLWSSLAIAISAVKDTFLFKKENAVVLFLSALAIALTIGSAVEQSMLVRSIQRQENRWKESRIASLQQDLRYCHPQWSNEREMIESQIHRYSSMLSDHLKSFWIYLDWITLLVIVIWDSSRIILAVAGELESLEYTMKISLTLAVFLIWMKFLKACRAFKIGGQYIAVLQQVIIALCKFAFLFFMFYIPFVVIFWIMFGGDVYGDKIQARYGKIGDAFRTLNDVAYTVWTLTVLVGFPMRPLKLIDETLIMSYLVLYYLVMSVITLNLFIAFLSNVFARVYKDAKKYALLEQATTILLSYNFVSRKKKQKVFKYMKEECNPLRERLKFRETLNTDQESPESTLQKVKNKMQTVADLLQGKRSGGVKLSRTATIRQIDHNMNMSLNTTCAYDVVIGKIQKFHVEIKKIQRILGNPVLSKTAEHGKSRNSSKSKQRK